MIKNISALGEDLTVMGNKYGTDMQMIFWIFLNGNYSGSIGCISHLSLYQLYETTPITKDHILLFVLGEKTINSLIDAKEAQISFKGFHTDHKWELIVDELNLERPPVGNHRPVLLVDLEKNHVKLTNNKVDMVHMIDKVKTYWW